MKCPRCGHEMLLDGHRKIDFPMCYYCGFIEGRNLGDAESEGTLTNYERLQSLDLNEAAAFIAKGLGLDEEKTAKWLECII